MRRKKLLWAIGTLVVVIGVPWGLLRWGAYKSEAAFEEQLQLARREGIPTNAVEYAASIQTAPPNVNAAQFYKKHSPKRDSKDDPNEVDLALIFRPGEATLSNATALLQRKKEIIEITDQATMLPRCWFDRDWKLGAAVLFPEYAAMKDAAKYLALRGSVSAHRGDFNAAIADVQRVLLIAKHASEEPHLISRLVGESIESNALRHLAYWSFLYRDRPEYALALKNTIDKLSPPKLKEEQSGELFNVLSMIELCSTPEGLVELGVKEEDFGALDKVLPLFMNQREAKVSIVKAHRALWAALDKPQAKRVGLIAAAFQERDKAMLAFPMAFKMYSSLTGGPESDGVSYRQPIWESRKQQFTALWRALKDKKIPSTIETSDLLSPFDGKPLNYKFDGIQIEISVSDSLEPSSSKKLTVPPKLPKMK